MDRIKVGVIGTGFIGPAHIEALRRIGNVDVVALADVNNDVARQKAEMLSVPAAYGDYRNMLKDPQISVVHICTPNHLHFSMAKEALAMGKHVVCEKPLAMTSSEAVELVAMAKHKKLANAVDFNLRFYPLIHQAREMVAHENLGRILAVNGSYQQDWLFYETDYNWRLEPEFSGDSRAIADIGSHLFDTVEYITGIHVKSVCADFATFHPIRKKPLKPLETYSGKVLKAEDYQDMPIHTEDYASVLLHFDNEAHGSLTVNQVASGRKNRLYFEIYGSKAAIAYDSERPNEMWIGRRDGNNEIIMKDPSLLYPKAREIVSLPGGHNEGFPDTTKQLLTKFYRYVREGAVKDPDFPTFEAGLRELVLCEAIVTSAGEKRWVRVS